MFKLLIDKTIIYFFIFIHTKPSYIHGVYSIRGRTNFCIKIMFNKELNCREIINTKEIFKAKSILTKFKVFELGKKYRALFFHIHPFICTDYLEKNDIKYTKDYLNEIEKHIEKFKRFPCNDFSHTVYTVNHERPILRILDAISLAGSAYNNENRYLYSNVDKFMQQ